MKATDDKGELPDERAPGAEPAPEHADGCAYYFADAADAESLCNCRGTSPRIIVEAGNGLPVSFSGLHAAGYEVAEPAPHADAKIDRVSTLRGSILPVAIDDVSLFTSVSPEDFAKLPRLSNAEIQAALDKGRAEAFPDHHPLAAAAPRKPRAVNVVELPDLDPGIRSVVAFLRDHDFDTTDSGDGVSKVEAIADGEAMDVPHVHIAVGRDVAFSEADRLYRLLLAEGVPVEVQRDLRIVPRAGRLPTDCLPSWSETPVSQAELDITARMLGGGAAIWVSPQTGKIEVVPNRTPAPR